jgi:acyl-CoA synthetase (AMP-forming)/AMP-acid ligase II
MMSAAELTTCGAWLMLCEIRNCLKDMITKRGESIASVEVETVLLKHLAVQEVVIVGPAHQCSGSGRFPASMSHAGTVAFLGHGAAHAEESIWSGRNWDGHIEAPFR